jgi:hypothetical protein
MLSKERKHTKAGATDAAYAAAISHVRHVGEEKQGGLK